ncbi:MULTISPECIES: hypothetical protein [unclassified Ruegeria]|uniref:hypothetical protein n=1 Tax=unclassified Ruegeria TaxID=2625375 RepID=UPI001491CECB|nr:MULTISPECIES: hypothetical protein [unclassified Ruegeria]NOD36026.1 hypothetical protein [Ruegeria sp. HKCCD7296]NOE43419.1 hypothetical protein [Ruegeria sp. HKCCD7319]
MADSNATLVLNGHNHFYERSKPLDASGTPSKDGTVIFISGAGGEILVDQVEPAAFADRLITNIPGILKLDFSSTGVRWSYLTSEGSTESDSGALSCQKGLQPYTAR